MAITLLFWNDFPRSFFYKGINCYVVSLQMPCWWDSNEYSQDYVLRKTPENRTFMQYLYLMMLICCYHLSLFYACHDVSYFFMDKIYL